MKVTSSVQQGPIARAGLTVNQDGTVKGARRQNDTKFGVAPRNLPDGAFVSLQSGRELIGSLGNVVNLDSAV
jgi:hypothetical protein